MNRTLRRIALLLLVSWSFAFEARSADPPDARWPVPRGWKQETFALPPDFAPDLPYHGTEDLRFMPGYFLPTAPDYWSYDFVWWLDQPPAFDATSLAATLTTYFKGLATAVGGEKYHFDPARYHAVLADAPAGEAPHLTGQVFTYDPFVTGLPIILNVEAELRSCPGTKQVAIVVVLSPKDTTDGVWKALRTTAGALVCGTAQPQETSMDVPKEFLLTSAATDFHGHPPHPVGFRDVRMGYVMAPDGTKQYMLCGGFSAAAGSGKLEWMSFATIKTSGYEQYVGAQPVSFCGNSSAVWIGGDLSSSLQSRLDSLR